MRARRHKGQYGEDEAEEAPITRARLALARLLRRGLLTANLRQLAPHHQVHRRPGANLLIDSVAKGWKIDAFEQGLTLAEQDW